MINLKIIKSLRPCGNRLDNYIKHYGEKSFTRGQFMGLKNITQEDKLWVAFRLMEKKHVKLCAADIAESVLHIFEAKFPGDNRPRLAVEAARTGSPDAARAAYAADAAYAYAADAAYAARAAAYAAYAAARAAADAAYAARAAAYAAYAAARAAYAADAAYAARAAAYAAYAADAAYAYAADAAYAARAAAYAAYAAGNSEKAIRAIVLKWWGKKHPAKPRARRGK